MLFEAGLAHRSKRLLHACEANILRAGQGYRTNALFFMTFRCQIRENEVSPRAVCVEVWITEQLAILDFRS
jgi:hypothetical protein